MSLHKTPATMRSLLAWAAAALFMSPIHASQAAELRLAPSADATIFYDLSGSGAYDAVADSLGTSLWASVTQSGIVRRSLIQFDLSAVPAGQRIVSAALDLYLERSQGDHDVSLHRLLTPWGEGSSQAFNGVGVPATPGDATWAWADYLVQAWDTPGGDFVAASSAVTRVNAESVTYRWSAPQLLADVQAWQADSGLNQGWVMIGREDQERNALRFGSREGAFAPELVLQLAPVPEAGTAAMLLAGLAVVGLLGGARQRRATINAR